MPDEDYIELIEELIVDMSNQTRSMHDCISIALKALIDIIETFEDAKVNETDLKAVARSNYEVAMMAMNMLNDEPEDGEDIH